VRPDEPPTSARVRLRLFYFRNGETLWSLSGQHSGVTDIPPNIPLTVHGETQARARKP
jgi:broad specificity phosphatase PhoE